MKAFVYHSQSVRRAYLLVPRQDDFQAVPADVRARLGSLRLVKILDLSKEKPLFGLDPLPEVRAHLEDPGYHLQEPRIDVEERVRSPFRRGS